MKEKNAPATIIHKMPMMLLLRPNLLLGKIMFSPAGGWWNYKKQMLENF
jgi:hypothetical protein